MALNPTASRFSVLPDDDTTDWKAPKDKNKKNKANNNKQENDIKKNKNKNKEVDDLRSAAFGASKGKKKKNKSNVNVNISPNKSNNNSNDICGDSKDFEDWKSKDEKMVNQAYTNDLAQALMASKLEFDEKEKNQKQLEKDKEREKPKKFTLEEFNKLGPDLKVAPGNVDQPWLTNNVNHDYEKLKKEIEGTLEKELSRDVLLSRNPILAPKQLELPPPPQVCMISMQQHKRELALRETEVALLKRDKEELEAKLAQEKSKTKKVVSILSEVELREKTELAVENEKLRKIRDELSNEVSDLVAQLQQERTLREDTLKEMRKMQVEDRYNQLLRQRASQS